METIRERLHLISFVFRGDRDLPIIREKAEIIAKMCHLSPHEVDLITASVSKVPQNILKNKTGKICWSLIRSPHGNGGMEITIENLATPQKNLDISDDALPARVLKDLKKIMDLVEIDEPHRSSNLRLLKWGPHLSFEKMHKVEEKIREKLFAKTEESCLENLRAKHEELLRMLGESSRQNEELDRLNVELFHLNRDLEVVAVERVMSEMALKVAHEIRNPATVTGGLVRSLVKEMPTDEKTTAKIETILEQIRKLEKIVQDFERLAAQRKLVLKSEDLIEMTRECVEVLRNEFRKKEVELKFEPENEPFMIEANKGMLKVSLTHILRNAQDACKRGGAVVIRINKTYKSYVVQIEDNGTGIPPEKLEHIFESFITTKPSRTGLGLPIVKQIVDEHQGRINIKSQPGKGTIVTMEFPIFAVSKI